MRKIVNGKTYNTTAARLVGEWRSMSSARNSDWCHEMLFQTDGGEYFLWGCGGTLSAYKTAGAVTRSSRAGITPLSLEKAMAWARVHLKHATYIKEFRKYEQVA
ncbi:hypothetical protein SAMN02745823_02932 [Sporobacter termitidis DSM 10068]|uniref:Uncharacterized protein n=1 Tax=Sporobacter termitidis DSM 10068 TaxID=1123282 RepID=A0A1M5YWL6_9FIRM|nr:hypothetical protein [Sporobacter termitidis]SHI16452.1 hypothetical protein SAMN02745823_02932 [Sporobacter termitidis DSM 10068]